MIIQISLYHVLRNHLYFDIIKNIFLIIIVIIKYNYINIKIKWVIKFFSFIVTVNVKQRL